jgi:DNA mismatch repair ATPase MutS
LGGTDPVVGNDISADGARLIMVTGANRGGKTTFLRSIGAAQLMAQCGMFVCAREFTAPIATGVHTHFRRTEDRAMVSGKLDEELARMSAIADRLTSGALVLCNESFMSTNDREGAEIAAEILRALTDLGVRVVFVTHLHTLAQRFHADRAPGTVFLTADASRSFRLAPGTPSPTAHAADLARRFLGRS